jgi:hypothetical protein
MNGIVVSLLIGVIAGVVDVVPMLLQKLDKLAIVSAFIHWIVLGLIIPHIDLGIAPWLTGMVVAVLTAVPIMVIVYPEDPKAIIPMLVASIVIGTLVGLAGSRFVG